MALAPIVQHLVIPGRQPDEKFVKWITNVLSPNECKVWIDHAEEQGFASASVLADGSKNPHRNNDRVLLHDTERSLVLFKRLQPHLPPKWGDRSLLGLNGRLSFLRYGPGEHYGKHVDVPYEDNKTKQRSFITVQLYLNEGFSGGETRFDQETGFTKVEERKYLDVVPKTGAVLLFEHELTHEGCAVTAGTKYAVRVDVMYSDVSIQKK
jgi:prolyl 4-hydroxylase